MSLIHSIVALSNTCNLFDYYIFVEQHLDNWDNDIVQLGHLDSVLLLNASLHIFSKVDGVLVGIFIQRNTLTSFD